MNRLLVISHTEHYRSRDGYAAWGATVRELDHLAGLCDALVHIAILGTGDCPKSTLDYQAKNIILHLLPSSGGSGLLAKLGILLQYPKYLRAILRELPKADAVHVRCPCNIGLLAVIALCFKRNPANRWLKYAGNWRPAGSDPLSYRLQRWLLRKPWHRGQVTVNGSWPGDPAHVHAFVNPCLEADELERGKQAAEAKLYSPPVRLLYVGRVEEPKGAPRAVQIAAALRAKGILVRLNVVGDGPNRLQYEAEAQSMGLADEVAWHGWLPRTQLEPLLEAAHFLVLPTAASEGWPKVLSEGMAYGCIPIAGKVSAIGGTLAGLGVGSVHDPYAIEEFAASILARIQSPEQWREEAIRCTMAGPQFSYEAHVANVARLLQVHR